jgi:hypothetical protein
MHFCGATNYFLLLLITITITYSRCVSVFLSSLFRMYISSFLRHFVLSVMCLAMPNFFTFSHKRHDFWKKKLLDTKCIF